MELSMKMNVLIQLAVAIPAVLKVLHTLFTSDAIYDEDNSTLIAEITKIAENFLEAVRGSKAV
jgi:hypothetical protein